MKVNYITIEREYGSGGTKIGRILSELTGIPCYGHEILTEVSKQYHLSIEHIQQYEETVTNSFLYSLFLMGQANTGNMEMLMHDGHIYVAEQQIIRQLASRGRAIFLGHCAQEALKGRGDVIRVYIRCTDEQARRERIIREYGIAPENAESTRKRYNKKRANYYYANTAKKWDDFRNYEIVLDSGRLGLGGCAAVLEGLFKKTEG